jgi:hypothetical protein
MSSYGLKQTGLSGVPRQIQHRAQRADLEKVSVGAARRARPSIAGLSEVGDALSRAIRQLWPWRHIFSQVIHAGRNIPHDPVDPRAGWRIGVITDQSDTLCTLRDRFPVQGRRDVVPQVYFAGIMPPSANAGLETWIIMGWTFLRSRASELSLRRHPHVDPMRTQTCRPVRVIGHPLQAVARARPSDWGGVAAPGTHHTSRYEVTQDRVSRRETGNSNRTRNWFSVFMIDGVGTIDVGVQPDAARTDRTLAQGCGDGEMQ